MSWQRSRETRRRLKKLSHETCGIIAGAWYSEEKGRYIKTCDRSTRKGFLRRVANRRVRRARNVSGGRHYRRVYDYWWQLY